MVRDGSGRGKRWEGGKSELGAGGKISNGGRGVKSRNWRAEE